MKRPTKAAPPRAARANGQAERRRELEILIAAAQADAHPPPRPPAAAPPGVDACVGGERVRLRFDPAGRVRMVTSTAFFSDAAGAAQLADLATAGAWAETERKRLAASTEKRKRKPERDATAFAEEWLAVAQRQSPDAGRRILIELARRLAQYNGASLAARNQITEHRARLFLKKGKQTPGR